ncbi:CPBP family intramembrane glutamic endopeptidase [Ktedonobacter racemifer]|uniref:Abortive infection protein n=1 Tax=Ktedonobacter racemifer DSM 44963 TaxID=485913 RepID=D6U7L2_KTERA|nr:CPBP family intramembrane glutamic endopeptidase [Ktedonobacter racemifer]EFH79873.1 Abortive infection protein [Ktedonobacter racemifer DSM 44963]
MNNTQTGLEDQNMNNMQKKSEAQHINEGNKRFQVWKSHPLVAYFVLAYAITWLFLGLVALHSHGLLALPSGLIFPLTLVGSIGLLLAALLLTVTTTGKRGMRAFFRQLLIWRVNPWWYLVVLFEPALVTLIVLAVTSLLGGPSFNFAHPPVVQRPPLPLPSGISPYLLIVPLFLLGGLLGGPLGEELGWRGYALAKLQSRYSALGASLILGVLWAVWHLPFFFMPGTTQSTTPFLLFAFGTLANSILFTWVYNHTRGSVLLTFLFHNALNITALYLPLSLWNDWQGVVAQCLVALVVVIIAGPARLSRRLSSRQTSSW